MVDYESLKKAIVEFGEVMVKMGSEDIFELHKHNTKFDDITKTIILDAGNETYWIDVNHIEYYWIHKVGKE